MKVFVTGGTGFVGKEVVRELAHAGHGIRLLTRSAGTQAPGQTETRTRVEVCKGGIVDREIIQRGVEGCDAVIHLVGIISEVGESTFDNVHLRGTETIVAACCDSGIRRLVHMSALGTRPQAASRYHQTKWAAEEMVRASGLETTIFRPSLVYGPGDQFTNLFANFVKFSPLVPLLGRAEALMQPVAVNNVAAAFAGALKEPASIGQTFDLCGAERLTLKQIVLAIENALKKRRWKVQIPLPVAQVQASVMEILYPALLRKAPPLNRDQLIMLQEDNVGDPWPANQLFGLKSIPFAEGLATYLTRSKSP